ncbi:MAG: bifunctional acetate--CoA ligase family protein/GNAT family N-acetyltransferase [Desulfamplus sp.]|nr:bifunctional acetate--CoA ligase family protein/GNAT family N-acetyltransferase [Desulfamplus sp.]
MDISRKYEMRIFGPDSLGIINTAKGLNAGCAHLSPLPGKIAFLSQSATVCSYILDLSIREKIGLSHAVSLGSMIDVDFADMIDYLGALNNVDSILIYMENITNIRNFMSAARSVSRVKPIIVVKSGRTGKLSQTDAVYDAAFRRAGILRVDNFQEMFDCAKLLAKQKRPKGSSLTIITNSDGAGAMAVDALGSYGMQPSKLSEQTIENIDKFLPENCGRGNPVNIPWDVAPELYLKAAHICAEAAETDALLLVCSPATALNPATLSLSLADYLKTAKCPIFTAWMGGTDVVKDNGINNSDIIAYDTPERGIRAFANLCQYYRNIETLQQIPVRRDKHLLIDQHEAQAIIDKSLEQKEYAVLTEIEAKNLVRTYGIRVNKTALATSLDEAISIANDIGYPVILKAFSVDIFKRSDNNTMLNLKNSEDVESAIKTIMENMIMGNVENLASESHIMGVTIQPMVKKTDYEIMMGTKQEKGFGPVIRFGMGGDLIDIHQDTALALPPLDSLLARALMEKTRISSVLKGYRYINSINSELIEDMLIRLSRLVTDFPQIEELEINPIIVSNGELVVTSVKAMVKRSEITPPMHLIISSYPFEYETEDETIDHEKILIRPIKPGDAPLLVQHFISLSPRTVYFRFFTPLKQLSHSMLIRLTQIDYDREIALIALMGKGEEQVMVGVARVIFKPDGKNGEFAVVLADKWHGKGIGASLLKRCLSYAAKKGLQKVCGVVLTENRQMLKLSKKLGFMVRYIAGSTEYELEIDLAGLSF